MSGFIENRKAARLEIDMTIALYDITKNQSIKDAEKFPVEVMNISKSGIGFTTKCSIEISSFYKARLNFPTKDTMDVIIRVVRSQTLEDGRVMFGGTFVGISETDKFKIEVFRLFNEKNTKQS